MKIAQLNSATFDPNFGEVDSNDPQFKKRTYYLVDDSYDFNANDATEIVGAEYDEWIVTFTSLGRTLNPIVTETKAKKYGNLTQAEKAELLSIEEGSENFNVDTKLPEWYDGTNWISLGVTSQIVHDQATPSTTWNIEHNKNRYPSVTLIDASGNVFLAEIQYTDLNNVVVTCSPATSGKAILN